MDKQTKTRKSNRSGSIYFEEKSKRWRAEIQWNDKNGETHRKSFSSQKKTVVKNKLDAFRKELLITDGNIKSKDITFEDYSEYWMTNIVKNKLKPSSYTRKDVTLNNQVYPYIGNIPINQITHEDIQGLVNTLSNNGLSYSTIKKAYEVVNECIKNYRIKNSIYFNPCEGVTLPSSKQRSISNITFFNDKQIELIKKEAVRQYGTGKPVYRLGHAIIVLMYTGMRIGELLALTWDDVDFDKKTISINKNAVVVKVDDDKEVHYKLLNQNNAKTKSSDRIIPMSEIAMNSLKELKKINGDKKYIMSTQNGKQCSPRNINRMFHSILKQTGIVKEDEDMCGVHSLRHTFATMLFKNGCDVKVVSEILGHSDTKITENIYIHVIQQQKVEAMKNIDNFSS